MTITEIPDDVNEVVRARRRKTLDELDYRRGLVRLKKAGYTQTDIARWLGISQPSVNSAMATAEKLPMPLEGFSGATPLEICQRYAAGFISRDQMLDELVRYPYVEPGPYDEIDWMRDQRPGEITEVTDALHQGIIDQNDYSEFFERYTETKGS